MTINKTCGIRNPIDKEIALQIRLFFFNIYENIKGIKNRTVPWFINVDKPSKKPI
tara:strand:- start:90 stop:254 length:165 start_codon:yes stop_codon:yes gene_type:complete